MNFEEISRQIDETSTTSENIYRRDKTADYLWSSPLPVKRRSAIRRA
jgi:hypothetical protein